MRRQLFALVVIAVLVAGCGGGGSTSPSAAIAQIAGVWRVVARATSITSTECIGQALNAAGAVGSVTNGVAQIGQTGSSVSVTTTDNDTGAATTVSR